MIRLLVVLAVLLALPSPDARPESLPPRCGPDSTEVFQGMYHSDVVHWRWCTSDPSLPKVSVVPHWWRTR